MTFKTCFCRLHIWDYRQSTTFTDCALKSFENGFIRSDSVISSESCINIRNSNFYIVQRFSTFHWLHKKPTVIEYSEHSWINSLSFFSSFVTDLRCLSIWFTAIFLILISSRFCYWFYSNFHCLLSRKLRTLRDVKNIFQNLRLSVFL